MVSLEVTPFAMTTDGKHIAVVCPYCLKIHWHDRNIETERYSGIAVPSCKPGSFRYFIRRTRKTLPLLKMEENV